jgi:uncharacterized repeat protein (TIGR01451 family)
LVSASAGTKTLTATYAGDVNFATSTSAGASHLVNAAATTTTITNRNPTASVTGQGVTVTVSVTSTGGTPSGSANVTDGTVNCTATITAGTGSCVLTPTSVGTKTFTATYAASTNFASSTSAGVSHVVSAAATTTTITADNPDPSSVGSAYTVNYTVVAAAPGSGTPTGNVTVSDGTDSCSGTVASGGCSLTSTTGGGKTLTATYAGDANYTGSGDTEPHTVTVADLTIAKSHSGSFTQGTNGTYTITVSNGGGAASSGTITVTDVLPTGLSYVSATGTGWSCSNLSGTVTCTSGNAIAASGSAPAITLTVAVGAGAVGGVTNTVTVSGGGDSNGGNNSASDPTTVNGLPDLTVAKSHSGSFTQGTNGVYTITVSNIGTAASSGTYTVSDPLPSGLTFVSGTGSAWDCSTSTSTTMTCTRSLQIPVSGSAPAITLTVAVGAGAVGGVTNTASVSGGGETNTGNNSASDPTTVNGLTDLTIAKSHSGSFTQGTNGVYTVTVSNGGTAASSGTYTVSDPLPGGLSFVSGTGTGWDCSTSTSTTMTCTRSTAIAASGSAPAITLTVAVGAGAVGGVTNTASVSAGGDSNGGNNSASDPTTVNGLTDLTIAKSHSGSFTQGTNGVYTVTVSNVGTAASSGTITVSDPLPGGLTFVSGTGTGWDCSTSTSTTMTCTRSSAIAASGSAPAITLTVAVGAGAVGGVTNTVSVSGGGDSNGGNNSASDPTTVNGLTDLTIAKTHSGSFTQGTNGSYTLTVSNGGTAASSGTVSVTDVLPASLTFVSAAGSGWSCNNSSGTVTCTSSAVISAGGSGSAITLTVNPTAAAVPSVTNTATVSGGGDSNGGNNSDGDLTTVNGVPDLTLVKTHSGNFTQGSNGSYTITVSNGGTAASSGTITVTDVLPASLTFVSANGTGWSCGNSSGTVTCTSSTPISDGGSGSAITLTVNPTAAAVPSVTNTASVSGGGETNTGNDSSSNPTTVIGLTDLTLTKTHGGNFTQGSDGSYTLTVSNGGTATSSGTITVTDVLPASLTFVSATGSGWSCNNSSGTVTCTTSNQVSAGGSAAAITLTVNPTAAAVPSVTNTASVSGGNDSNTGNNNASSPTTVNGLPDLIIDKAHTDNFNPDADGDYTITVSNNGTAASSGTITVTDVLPAGLTYVSAGGTNWSCGEASGTVTCTSTSPIATSSSAAPISLTVHVDAGASGTQITNTATVSGGGDSSQSSDDDPTDIN